MSTGYAATLVTRSRGQAPLLMPITPSRFEPDVHPADLHDDLTVEHRPEPTDAQTPDAAIPERASARGDHAADSPPLLGRRPAPGGPAHDDFPSSATQPTAPTAEPRTARPDHPPGVGPAEQPDAPLIAPRAPAGQAHAVQPERPDTAIGDPLRPAAQAAPEPAQPIQRIVTARRADADDRSAARQAATRDEVNDEPAVVVRIGRLDVRAVQTPAAPRAQPRPRPAATPSLEERLAARDRQ